MDRPPTPEAEPLQADPTRDLFRDDLVAFLGGVLCFPIALLLKPSLSMWVNQAVLILLPLLLVAMVASIIVSGFVDWKAFPPFRAPGLAARSGARIGAITVIIGGGATMVAATFHALGFVVDASAATSPWLISISVTLSALPTIFCASFAAYLIARIRNPRTSPRLPISDDQSIPKSPTRGLLPYFVIFGILSFLSPITVHLIPEPSKVVETAPPPKPDPSPIAPAPVITPPPPVFAYERPPDFEKVSPIRRQIVERKYLHDVLENRPMAISPNGRLFAYYSDSNATSIRVIDLNTCEPTVTFPNIPYSSRMAWSPDSKKLICISDNSNPPITIHNLTSQDKTLLPIPKKDRVPRGQPFWWSTREVAFFDNRTPGGWLNLDSLQVKKMESSLKWHSLPKLNDDSLKNFPDPILPHSEQFEMTVVPQIKAYTNPHFLQPQWTTQSSLYLGLVDPSLSSQRIFTEIDLTPGDHIGSAPDGSIFIRVRNQTATIYYFGLNDKTPKIISLSKPNLPDETTLPLSLERHLEEKSLCVFVCAPLINPLTQQVVGPDRDRVKGIARFMSWTNDQAKFWLAEEYSPISEGDILADPHVWIKGKPEAVNISPDENWWATVPSQDDAPDLTTISTRMLDRKFTPEFRESFGLPSLSRVTYSEPPKPIVASPPVPITSADSLEETIRTFIHDHHVHASRRNLYAFVDDYSDSADLYSHGVVDRTFIRKDQQEFYQSYTKVTETVIGEIEIEEAEPRRYEAIYKLEMELTDQSNKVSKKQVFLTLLIDLTSGKPQIIRERTQPITSSVTADTPPSIKTVYPEEKVISFILEHYRKAAKPDLEGFLLDYTDTVDYYTAGKINRSTLRKNSAYLRGPRGVNEAIKKISLGRDKENPNIFAANFERRTSGTMQNGKKIYEDSYMMLLIRITANGPKIFSENGKILSRR